MKSLNKSVDIKIYIGAGHAFQNPDNQPNYRIVLKLEPTRGSAFWPSSPRLREQM